MKNDHLPKATIVAKNSPEWVIVDGTPAHFSEPVSVRDLFAQGLVAYGVRYPTYDEWNAIAAGKTCLDTQVGGDHYKKLGAHQPWEVLRTWLTPEEYRGYMKGTAIVYLARERDKGGTLDIEKALHTLQGFIELAGAS